MEKTKREEVRSKISIMSFEELLQLKEKIGTKMLDESISSEENVNKHKKTNFKRANKNRPREMSSKIKPSRITNIIKDSSYSKRESRDPRFDPLCGAYDDRIFKDNYKFVYSLKVKEINQLQKELETENDPKRVDKIKFIIQRLKNQITDHEKKEKEAYQKKLENEQIKESLKNEKKPIFKKKSEKQLENAIEKFEDLKKSNQLNKYIKRKSKKLSQKDKKAM